MDAISRRSLHQELRTRRTGAAAGFLLWAALAAACVLSAAASTPVPGVMGAMAPNLTGAMASLRYLIGDWSCTIHVSSTKGESSSTEPILVVFSTSPNDSLLALARARSFTATAFFGYDSRAKKYWLTAIDNEGARVYETSPDGSHYTGTVTAGVGIKAVRDTWVKKSDANFGTTTEIRDGDVWKKTAEHACVRT